MSSPLLVENGLKANIPTTLLFCHVVIRLDTSISEQDFWDGVESSSPVVEFHWISIRQEDNNVRKQTPLVELKFLSRSLPPHIYIFKAVTKVEPSITDIDVI